MTESFHDSLVDHYREVRKRLNASPKPQQPPVVVEAQPEPSPEPLPPPPPPPLPKHKMQRIARIVCEHYDVPWQAISSPRRYGEFVEPRHVFFYLCREVAKQSYPLIGRFIGRDHSSVLHGHRKIEARIENDEELAAVIEAMTKRFNTEPEQ